MFTYIFPSFRSNETENMTGWCWEDVLCSDPEMLIRQASVHTYSDTLPQ